MTPSCADSAFVSTAWFDACTATVLASATRWLLSAVIVAAWTCGVRADEAGCTGAWSCKKTPKKNRHDAAIKNWRASGWQWADVTFDIDSSAAWPFYTVHHGRCACAPNPATVGCLWPGCVTARSLDSPEVRRSQGLRRRRRSGAQDWRRQLPRCRRTAGPRHVRHGTRKPCRN